MQKIFLRPMGLCLCVCCLFVGCIKMQQPSSYEFSGTLELTEHSLGARSAGRVTSLTVEEGDHVKAGQLIATLDRFEQTQKDFHRAQELFHQGGATQQDLERAALSLQDEQIVSPIDGVVLVKVKELGEIVAAGAAVAVIGDRKSLWVRIFVPEGMINTVRMNQSARVRVDGTKEIFSGQVSFISSQAEFTPRNVQTSQERITQGFAVKVTLDHPPEFLRPGVAADVVLEEKDEPK